MSSVSVLVAARDAEPFVADALASILGRDADLEVIVVVDNGSTDGTADAIRGVADARVRLVRTPPRGLAHAFNAALALARGPVIARCDADDRFAPGRLARQLAWLDANPDFVAVAGSFSALDALGRPVPGMECPSAPADITAELLAGVTRTHLNTFAIRSEALRRTGGFRPFFRSAGDIDLQCRLARTGPVWYDPAPAYEYRLHDASVTHSLPCSVREWYEATARRLARQRRGAGADDLDLGRPPSPPALAGQPTRSAEHTQGLLLGAAWRAHAAGDRLGALRLGRRALVARPWHPAVWRSLLALAWKPVPTRGSPSDACDLPPADR